MSSAKRTVNPEPENGHHQKIYEQLMLEMMWRKGTLLHCWWECKLVQTLWRIVWRVLNKLKMELPYDSTIPLLGIYPKKTIIQKDTCIPMFTAALFNNSQEMEQPRCPLTEEWMKKVCYIYIMEYYSAIKGTK